MKFINFTKTCFYADFHRWPLWAPVFLGIGICLYFSLPVEPPLYWLFIGFGIFFISLIQVRLQFLRLLILGFGFIILGFSISFLRTTLLKTEMLQYPLKPLIIESIVSQVELKPTKKGDFYQKLILTNLKADTPETLPEKVRITMKGKRERLWPGQVIRLKVKLNPIPEPSLPGEFDFRRQAYFSGIGATGFALSPPEVIGNTFSWNLAFEKRREKLTAYFIENMKPPHGAIAAALITGDKAAIPDNIREEFVQSGLAHILAISGLHLSIIAGVVFMVIRKGISIIPTICLRYSSKKIAALGTILMTFVYLILSGFGIPAQRAFIMISLVMGAIILDRTALSIRTVALAAFLILFFLPEALLGPSFQLSFSAVIALITGHETWKNPMVKWMINGGKIRKVLAYVGGLAFTSFLATLATLPFTIYLFHRFSLHAIEANLVAVPLTSLFIMPAAFLTCLLSPLGIGDTCLWAFETSIEMLLKIASLVSSWCGSNIWVARPPLYAFVLVIVGSLWLSIWQQSWRRWGLVPLLCGFLLAFKSDLPHLLVDGNGKLVGLFDKGTLYVSSLRKGKFTAENWKKYLAAKDVKSMPCENGVCKMLFQNKPIVVSYEQDNQPCVKSALLIYLEPKQKACSDAFHEVDWYSIWRAGGFILWLKENQPMIETVRNYQGKRPWTRKAIHRKNRPSFAPNRS